ncbi:germination protein M [Halobacillus karajensis]|uniref:Spore germination protein GerM n=1 Tax=Halobacillus karajensis TaxID=195088 RepID=A0A024P7E5_9BACI|nr:GerMN domain-containing protein [Halobacillus karajensis]CDQ18224.1 Spore germination protein GerM [Halobacillus karajensis]CDQ24576.1 Spore germination protein GerM [Halobacillus karajensis]CDQ29177.1 Spore germination protein GerM [Halobacillus karajensis]SEH56885.1 germination protein M [Halobacillus karajensis]
MKKYGYKPLILTVFLVLCAGLLSGCLFEGEQSLEKMDTPEEAASTPPDPSSDEPQSKGEGEEAEGTGEAGETEDESAGTVSREVYLLDANGMVAPQTLELPASEEVATQVLEYMVKDGPVTNLLPNGFEAVLPAGTEINGVNAKEDGTLVVDVSEDFKNYEAKDEEKILQAMTYTLTQFDNVKRIKLWINGHEQDVMPVDGTPISEGVSRSDGINNQVGMETDIMNSEAVTVYFPAQNGEQVYQVPVTTRVSKGDDEYAAMVQALLEGPEVGSPLMNPFNEGSEMVKSKLENGVLALSFNENILTGTDEPSLSDAALASLVMSLTDLADVESVEVHVDGTEQVFNEAGEPLAEPVSRQDINGAEEM